MKKAFLLVVLSIISMTLLSACGSSSAESKKVTIGVTGTDGKQWEVIKEKAAEEGIEIELVEFSDYTLPNQALANGDIDLNAFQHIAFLNQFKQEHDLNLVPIGTTLIAPMGLYSEKFASPDEIPDGSEIAIPNDPTNQARALKLLQDAGLLTLSDDFGLFGTPEDIADNPKGLKITPIVAQQTPRVLKDVAASVINNGIAGQAGFVPNEDSIFFEDPDNEGAKPYINIIAAREEDKDNEVYKRIVEIHQSEAVEEAIIEDTNGGSVVVRTPISELQDVID
ncbi:MetQ/NlpA family ABC transporter substrate-binding protein [Salinibacillus xinjiangensis]|uniref:Lipoprotein n=1 Tax=Salinibacillus xinjiangensis TaxID=1229268 RepID=A0A6G1X5X7_9BACI|nr:MetQ/NlpA family ABC transporter substrate-binding protein [Salinibacillus xinjiangensis]MRG86342.1 MetQ/NlpA family ABC transporter substrate-binding protein [Salinibacillus xinjiangensis]